MLSTPLDPDGDSLILQSDMHSKALSEAVNNCMCHTRVSHGAAAAACSPGLRSWMAALAGMGTVAKVGEGVTGFQPGQRVVGMPWGTKTGDGSWQQYAVVSEGALVAVPDAVTDEAAAQYAVNPMTAYGLLDVSSESAVGCLSSKADLGSSNHAPSGRYRPVVHAQQRTTLHCCHSRTAFSKP